jgi:16S rRNA (cytosine1402-N4)-methyltransferase
MSDTKKNNQNQTIHIPVLPEAVLRFLQPKAGESYLDLTAGYGGHAAAVLERTFQQSESGQTTGNTTATLVDRDHNAIAHLQDKFKDSGIQIIHKDFLGASQELARAGKQFDLILADLGVSSPHLDNASRGFSLREDGPLDMRMDQTQSLTAETVVNSYGEAELRDLIRMYGEEPRASRIARLIAEHRPIKSTTQLAEIVAQAWPGHSKVHPATRTFQALRIAVNSELEQIRQAIPLWVKLLAPGGRIVVISFHSLEDRIVKQSFQELAGDRYDAVLTLLTRQPVMAEHDELVFNPRARSAKLRAAAKINTKTERGD